MDVSEMVYALREKGRLTVRDGNGRCLELLAAEQFDPVKDQDDAVFLLHDLFQIRGVGGQFSEVALDIVEYATKPTVYATMASPILSSGPVKEGTVRFGMLRQGFWHKVIFNYSRPLLFQPTATTDVDFQVKEGFPFLQENTIHMFLSPEGEVKIGR